MRLPSSLLAATTGFVRFVRFVRFVGLAGLACLVVFTLPGCNEDGPRRPADAAHGDRGTARDATPRDGAADRWRSDSAAATDGPTPMIEGIGAPRVSFVSPADGAVLPNPVRFVVAAQGVAEVEIIVDGVTHLATPWDPSQRNDLLYRFSGTGKPRTIRLSGRNGGQEVTSATITITVQPDSCEDLFFTTKFNSKNVDPTGKLDLVALREAALVDVRGAVAALQACGAKVTLGGMLSLLYFEGGLQLAFYNTKCSENSYHKMASGCDAFPKALYSYQLGLGTIHTSNFHPCAGTYTDNMRKKLLAELGAAGFSTSSTLVTPAIQAGVASFCGAGTTASAVDYYIQSAHALGVPKNGTGNALAAVATFPFFSARVSVATAFAEMAAQCAQITSDSSAIAVYGGSSSYYKDPANQQAILGLYNAFAAASCP